MWAQAVSSSDPGAPEEVGNSIEERGKEGSIKISLPGHLAALGSQGLLFGNSIIHFAYLNAFPSSGHGCLLDLAVLVGDKTRRDKIGRDEKKKTQYGGKPGLVLLLIRPLLRLLGTDVQDRKETGEAGDPACWGLASQMLRLIGCLSVGSFEMQAFSVNWARTAAHSGYPGRMCPFS